MRQGDKISRPDTAERAVALSVQLDQEAARGRINYGKRRFKRL